MSDSVDALITRSAADLADALASGETTSVALTQACLDRIRAVDGGPEGDGIHAFLHVDADGALAQAAASDARRAAGEPASPLDGVPIAVKDVLATEGLPTTCGSRILQGWVPPYDATVVARLKAAGLPILGKTNMDEFAMGSSTEHSAYGPTANPWALDRVPGGSSGGSAAAVAAHEAPLAVGTDTGGSVREPASQCGLVGMAPSPGVVPMRGVVPFAPGLDRVGPLARSVRDLAQLLAVMTARPRLAGAVDATDVRGLRVGVVEELRGPRNQAGVLARLDVVLAALTDLGVELVPVSAPAAGRALPTYMTVTSASAVTVLEPYVRTGLAGPEVLRRYEWGIELLDELPGRLEAAEAARRTLHGQVLEALAGCDLLVSPTMPTTAPLLDGHASPEDLADPLAAPYTDCWTVVANLVGLPALSLPSGRSLTDGMPVGTMLMGLPRSDHLLLGVAAALEAAGVDRG